MVRSVKIAPRKAVSRTKRLPMSTLALYCITAKHKLKMKQLSELIIVIPVATILRFFQILFGFGNCTKEDTRRN